MPIHALGHQCNKDAPGTVFHSRILHSVSAVNVLGSNKRTENRRSKESWEADCDCAQNITYNSTVYFKRQPSPCLLAPALEGLGYNTLHLSIGPASLGQIPGKA